MKWTKYVFFIFWAISLLSFIPSIGSGFVYDFIGWQNQYDPGSFVDIIDCFGYKGNHQFLHLIFYSFYKIFFIQGLPWYLLFCSLHAVNAYLFYFLIIRLMQYWGGSISPVMAALGAIAFLLHPYSVEPVAWKVCVHYLISLMAVLSIIIFLLDYMQTGDKKKLIAGSVAYFLSLFTLEISFMTPMTVVLAGIMTWCIGGYKKNILIRSIKFSGALWALLAGYLVLNKLTLGNIVGHYGVNVHLQFDLMNIVSTETKYIFKHLFYARYYSFKTKNLLFDQILSLPEIAFFVMTIVLALTLVYFIRIKKLAPRWHVFYFCMISSLLYILPVSNLFFYHLHIGMNDRFSYIAIAFICGGLVSLLSGFSRWVSYSILGIIILINIYFQQKTVGYWHQSTEVLQSLKTDFRWHDAPMVFALNSPDNMHGIVMTSIINAPSGIDELLDFQTPRPYNGKMFDVLQFNMTTPSDGVKVEQTGPMQLKVTFNQWGNWWHRNGIGAGSYENEFYKVELLDYPYLITFKQFPEGSVIIYQDGMMWKEFVPAFGN